MLRKILLYSCLIGTALPPFIHSQQAQPPQANEQQTPGQGQPLAGQMQPPSEEELEQMMEMINELSEEDQQALEELGREIINNMSDEELQELSEAFGVTPEELRADAQRPPQQPTQPKQPQKPEQPQQPQKQQEQQFLSTQETQALVNNTIMVLEKLIQKADLLPQDMNKLEPSIKEMQDIVAYLKIIRNKQHMQRLASNEYKDIVTTLQMLTPQLQKLEPRIEVPEVDEEQNPYQVLGLTQQATQQEIQQQYEKLKSEKSPEEVEKRLQEQGASPRQIKKAVRDARIAFTDIQEAYNTLSDPKMREQIQRQKSAQQKQLTDMRQTVIETQNEVVNTLKTAIENNNIISRLEAFLKAYEPQELEKKKQLEKAEQEQRKSQKERERQRPPQPGGQRLEPRPKPPKKIPEPRGGAAPAPQQPTKTEKRDSERQKPKQDDQKQKAEKADQKKDKDTQKPNKQDRKQQPEGKKKTKTQQIEQQEHALSFLQKELDTFGQTYKQYKQSLEQARQTTEQIKNSSNLSQEQQNRLANITQSLQQFKNKLNIENIQVRLQNIPNVIADLANEQRNTWKQSISPRISELNTVYDTIEKIREQLQGAPEALRNNNTVNDLENICTELINLLDSVSKTLETYDTFVHEDQSAFSALGKHLEALWKYYNNNSQTLGNLPQQIQNLSGKETTKIDETANTIAQHIEQLIQAISATENRVNITTITEMLQTVLLSQQQQEWSKAISDTTTKALETLIQDIQTTWDYINDENLFSQDQQNCAGMQRLQEACNTFLEMTKNTKVVIDRLQEEAKKLQEQQAHQKQQKTEESNDEKTTT